MRWWLGLLLVWCLGPLTPTAVLAADRQPDLVVQQDRQEFILFGSSKSNKFHRPSCQYVQRIKPGNVVGFRSRDEAIGMGYVPCKVCRP